MYIYIYILFIVYCILVHLTIVYCLLYIGTSDQPGREAEGAPAKSLGGGRPFSEVWRKTKVVLVKVVS